LKEKEIIVPSFTSKPEENHCSKINLRIKAELLLLSTKKGSLKFNVGLERDLELANKGINKYILSFPICLIKLDNSVREPSK